MNRNPRVLSSRPVILALLLCVQERGLTIGESPETVPSGHVRTTLGGFVRRQPDGSIFASGPRMQIDVGLSEWAELGLEWDLRTLVGSDEFDDRILSPGDPIWRVKIVPFRQDGWSVGGLLAFKLPSAEEFHGTGTDTGDAHVRLFGTRTWDDWTVGATLGLAVLGDRDKLANVDPMFVWSAWVRWRPGMWTLAAELRGSEGPRFAGSVAEGWVGDGWVGARVGVARSFDVWEVGLGFEAGLTDESPEWEIMAFVARGWDAFSPRPRDSVPWFLDAFPTRRADSIPPGLAALGVQFIARGQSDESRLLSSPRLTIAAPLGENGDLRIDTEMRWLQESAEFEEGGGLGDFFAEARWIPVRVGDFRGGVLFGGKIPLAGRRRGLTTGQVDWFTRLLFTWAPSALLLHANAGLAVNDFPFMRNSQTDALHWGFAAEYLFHPRLTGWLGLDGTVGAKKVLDISQGWAGRRVASLRGAIQWRPPGDSVMFSLSGSGGLTDESPRWEIETGIVLWLR